MFTYAPFVAAAIWLGWAVHVLVVLVLARRLVHARRDELTGLFLRGVFVSCARRRMRRRAVVCGLIDVNRFKHINDTYGHRIGDTVLATLARRLREELPHGAVAGRWGGDELVVAVPVERAAGLDRLLSRPVVVPGCGEDVTVSLGWSAPVRARGRHGAEAMLDRAMRAADTAMYASKRGPGGGGGRRESSARREQRRTQRSRAVLVRAG